MGVIPVRHLDAAAVAPLGFQGIFRGEGQNVPVNGAGGDLQFREASREAVSLRRTVRIRMISALRSAEVMALPPDDAIISAKLRSLCLI